MKNFKALNTASVSIFIANLLDHFDSNLYAFMVPIMSPLFFPDQSYIVQLILGYSFLLTSSITRPVGVILFGYLIGKRFNVNILLKITLLGVGISTFLIGILPTYNQVGYFAALLLFFIRLLGGLFAQGEKTIVSIYCAKNVKTNAGFEIAVIGGCALASLVGVYITPAFWRLPFLAGGFLAFYAFFLRSNIKLDNLNISYKKQVHSWLFIALATICGGLYYVTYDLIFVFLNAFVPMITNITHTTMMQWNTIIMLIDMMLFVPMMYVVPKFNLYKIKNITLLMLAIPAIPFFMLLSEANLAFVLFVRLWIAFWGVMFSTVMNVHLLSLSKYNNNYLVIGLTNALGVGLIGRSTTSLCLWGYSVTGVVWFPGAYLTAVALLALILNVINKANQE